MGTYSMWRTHADQGVTRRVTYVCGDQRALVEDVVATVRRQVAASELDSISTTGADRELWALAHQHPMVAGAARLIVVRDAEKVSNWAPLPGWLANTRQLPGVHLLFVSGAADLPREKGPGKRAPTQPHIEAMKPPRGFVVKCSALSEKDAIAWVRSRSYLDEHAARHLLTRVGGNLSAAGAVCAKVVVFGDVAVTTTIIDQLTRAIPADTFVDSLLTGNKNDAFTCIADIDAREYSKVVGLLDSRLDLLTLLWESQAGGRYGQAVPGVNPFLVRHYTPIAKHYEPRRCAYSRQVLAVVDDALRSGARDGVWEALVALW